MAGLFIYGSLLSQVWHLSFKVNTLLGFISWWQEEQFLLMAQKARVRARRRLRKVRVKISLFMVGLLLRISYLVILIIKPKSFIGNERRVLLEFSCYFLFL